MDKTSLDRILICAKIYLETNSQDSEAIYKFVEWLYNTYGILLPEKRK